MIRIGLFALLLIALVSQISADDLSPVVYTDRGPIRGKVYETILNKKKFISFTGIPFAKPPIGDLRFKAPEDVDPWTEVYNAVNEGNICPQLDGTNTQVIGDEDCLTLNVYVPQTASSNSTTKLSTMVFIYGGAFSRGFKNREFYGPDYLMEQDIIVVLMNYRLSAFGFVYLNDPRAPGNQAFRDQNMALQWVSRNIDKFGGDPKQITLTGESAGSASVYLQMISKLSKGLFQRSIAQSGTPLTSQLNTQSAQDAEAATFRLVAALGKITNNKDEAMQTLMSASTVDIVNVMTNLSTLINPLFKPMVDASDPKTGQPIFLNDCPIKKFISGDYRHMPHIMGRTANEALSFSLSLDMVLQMINATINEARSRFPMYVLSPAVRDALINGINSPSESLSADIIKTASKLLFDAPEQLLQRFMSLRNGFRIYDYIFSFETEHSLHKPLYNVTAMGAGHTDDLPMMFYMPIVNPPTDINDPFNIAVRKFTCLWSNFVKTGNPTPRGAKDICSTVTWEDSRLLGRQMNISLDLKMINRQTDRQMRAFETYTRSSSLRNSGCKSILSV